MNINTNYSAQIPVDNGSKVTFQARFISDLPVKNLEKFVTVQDMFAQKTQHYANDVLTLTKSKDPSFKEYSVLTTGKIVGEDYKFAHIVENFDEMLESLPENQLVKKLVSYFKMLKKEEELSDYNSKMDKTIEHVRTVLITNTKRAKYCEDAGDKRLAARFNALAENNQKKLISLQEEKHKGSDKILGNMDKIAENEPDLQYVPEILRDDSI